MFERFTDEARDAVRAARREAADLRHDWIGTEHVLLGVLDTGGPGAQLLGGFGIDAGAVRADVVRIVGEGEDDLDPAALAVLGIDLDAVRERVERAFGPGALRPRRRGRSEPCTSPPLTPRAKKAFELALRESVALGARRLCGEHLVLGLLREGDGVAAQILRDRGVGLQTARARVASPPAA